MLDVELKLEVHSVETRAWLEDLNKIKNSLEELGAEYLGKTQVADEIYVDIKEISLENHTFDARKKAARIRELSSEGDSKLIAVVKQTPENFPSDLNLHDLTVISFYEEAPISKKDKLLEKLTEKGFTDLLKTIEKIRDVYKYENSLIFIDTIKNFGNAIEIRTEISDLSLAKETKDYQLQLLKQLGIPAIDLVEKSYTHQILDSHIKSNPELKIPFLKSELGRLQEKREELLLRSEEHYREGGDGWHDNASWDILMERVKVLDSKIANLRTEILEARKKRV